MIFPVNGFKTQEERLIKKIKLLEAERKESFWQFVWKQIDMKYAGLCAFSVMLGLIFMMTCVFIAERNWFLASVWAINFLMWSFNLRNKVESLIIASEIKLMDEHIEFVKDAVSRMENIKSSVHSQFPN